MAREVIAIKNIIRYTLLIALVFAACIPALTARAEGGGSADWINGEIVGEKKENESYLAYGDCTNQNVRLLGKYGAYIEQQLCVFSGKSYKYAIEDGTLYVSMGNDATMYMVYDRGFASRMPVLPSPATDDFIFGGVITKDLPGHLSLVTTPFAKYYTQDPIASQLLTKDEDGSNYFTLEASAVSRNGQWMIVSFKNVGLVRINLADMSATRIAEYVSTTRFLAISNDGKSVAESSVLNQWQPVVYSVENCGQTASVSERAWYDASLPTPCRNKNLYGIVNTLLGTTASSLDGKPEFDDAGQLLLYVYPDGASKTTKVTLHVVRRETDFRLDYLALGDSYSSGEGDNDDEGLWYRKGTEKEGQCHLSARAYPYLLRDAWNIEESLMRSVACSGALVKFDYTESIDAYLGQHKELEGLPVHEKDETIEEAMKSYSPGVVSQLEFVKRYKPKVVTITGGGNDVGFKDILQYCANDFFETIAYNYSCEYVAGGPLNQILIDSIKTQYQKIQHLINEIKLASPGVKIYYIGYPSFIGGSNTNCMFNSGILDRSERDMINDAVTRLNGVIRKAAASTGVQYVDVESALNGGRLCEGSEYMTGILKAGVANVLAGRGQDAFHPNSEGQEKIKESILAQVSTPLDDYSPSIVDTISVEPSTPTSRARFVKDSELSGEEMLEIRLQPSSMPASSDVIVAGFSTPVQLGSYKPNEDGSFDLKIKLPATLHSGKHLILMTIYSGGDLRERLYDFVTVVRDAGHQSVAVETSGMSQARKAEGVDKWYGGVDNSLAGEGLTGESQNEKSLTLSTSVKNEPSLRMPAIVSAILLISCIIILYLLTSTWMNKWQKK